MINWAQYKYYILYDATEKGCKTKLIDEGATK